MPSEPWPSPFAIAGGDSSCPTKCEHEVAPEEHPDDRPHRRRQNGNRPPPGQADRRPVHQGRSHQVHRSRLLRPRRGEHGPRTGRERDRAGARTRKRAAVEEDGAGRASRNDCSTCWLPSPVRGAKSDGDDSQPGALPADSREDAGHARAPANWTSGASKSPSNRRRRPWCSADGHGTDGRRFPGHVRKDHAQADGAARYDRRRGPPGPVRSRSATPCSIRKRSTPRRSTWPKNWASSSSTKSTRSWPATPKAADVSRQGVQRDLLPIVEGTTVQTRYGYVRTDHVLFVAAGAFHRSQAQRTDARTAGPLSDPRRTGRPDEGRLRPHSDRTPVAP